MKQEFIDNLIDSHENFGAIDDACSDDAYEAHRDSQRLGYLDADSIEWDTSIGMFVAFYTDEDGGELGSKTFDATEAIPETTYF